MFTRTENKAGLIELPDDYKDVLKHGYIAINKSPSFPKNAFIDHRNGRTYLDVDINAIKHLFSAQGWGRYRLRHVMTVQLAYDPYRPLFSSNPTSEFGEIDTINIYEPPAWKAPQYYNGGEAPRLWEGMSETFEKYLDIISNGDRVTKERILKWLKTLLVKKNKVALVGAGGRGCGKSLLGKIIAGIVGRTNYTQITADHILQGGADTLASGTQVVHLDGEPLRGDYVGDSLIKLLESKYKSPDGPNIYVETHSVSDEMRARAPKYLHIIDFPNIRLTEKFDISDIEIIEANDGPGPFYDCVAAYLMSLK